jgi:Flp pilus assembly protein protease CpaA
MDWVAIAVGFLFLLYASIHDFRTREVPDLVSYGLILFAVSYGIGKAMLLASWQPLVEMLLGFGALFVIGLIMYYSGQWGGADSKLLMGLGALLGLGFANWDALLFLLFLLFAGAAYGIIYAAVLAIIEWKRVFASLKQRMHEPRVSKIRKIVLAIAFLLLLSLLFVSWEIKPLILGVILVGYFGFYLWLCVKVIEEELLIKAYPVKKLTEGDWINEEVKIKGKVIVGPKDLGITKAQITQLKKLKVKKVMVKEGIPFVPSFLLAYVLFLLLKETIRNYFFF